MRPLPHPICRHCNSSHTTRTRRKTFFLRAILRFNLHPWKCHDCSHRFLSKNRGLRKPGQPRSIQAADHPTLSIQEHMTS
jgi:hypothetical protein